MRCALIVGKKIRSPGLLQHPRSRERHGEPGALAAGRHRDRRCRSDGVPGGGSNRKPPQPAADEVWSPKASSRQLRSSCRRGRRAVTHGHAEDERQHSFPMENKL